ncbi:hypothetical protein AVEN_99727-1 [Araneus ventricosus]|uniref:Uncharacterized protein n=1 Tax=Araneus ventricosus TaxID=182803 RepID=A0A4Y2RQQ3_ARAVE|nr:hypothetical protein AVEN_99727-1 [Araneus ventricosus]
MQILKNYNENRRKNNQNLETCYRKYNTSLGSAWCNNLSRFVVEFSDPITSLANAYGYDSYPNTPQSTLQSPDPGYHDSHSSDMQAGAQFPEVDYDLLNMEFAPEVDEPVDFSSINVCDLVSYTHSS